MYLLARNLEIGQFVKCFNTAENLNVFSKLTQEVAHPVDTTFVEMSGKNFDRLTS